MRCSFSVRRCCPGRRCSRLNEIDAVKPADVPSTDLHAVTRLSIAASVLGESADEGFHDAAQKLGKLDGVKFQADPPPSAVRSGDLYGWANVPQSLHVYSRAPGIVYHSPMPSTIRPNAVQHVEVLQSHPRGRRKRRLQTLPRMRSLPLRRLRQWYLA